MGTAGLKSLARLTAGMVALWFSTMSGCGGGGQSASTPPINQPSAPSSTDIQAAYSAAVTHARTYSLSGSTSGGLRVSATLSITPGSPVAYEGLTFDTSTLTSTTSSSTGSLLGTSITTLWLQRPNGVQAFEASSGDHTCVFTTNSYLLPTAAALGTTGPYVRGTQYPGCSAPGTVTTASLSVGTVTQVWAYTAIGSGGYVCMTASTTGFVGTSTEQDCFEVTDSLGTLGTRARITVTDLDGTTTILTNS